MRSRIVFRGLTLFTFSRKDAKEAGPNENLGTMTAWLINDPDHAGKGPLHTHVPMYAAIGRNVDPNGPGQNGMKMSIDADLRIKDVCYGDTGVIVDGSFLDYVPSFGDLRPDVANPRLDLRYAHRKIVIPQGRVRAGEFISWEWYGKTPARVAYMGTLYGGFATNEVIVDIGDDNDFEKDDEKCFLQITHGDNAETQKQDRLWPKVKGGNVDNDIEPNTVEVLITNLPARRRRPVFWGLHFQTIFTALGCPPLDYLNTPQYNAFEGAARAYDAYEWRNDSMTKPDQPFPFLVDPTADRLSKIAQATVPYVVNGAPPTPLGMRQSGEGIPAGGGGGGGGHVPGAGSGSMPTGHDPHNTEICPYIKI